MKGAQLGPYRIEGELASGGMATVYVATHQRLGHVVAVKILHPHFQKDEQLRSRFVDEARIQANLRHPNILTVHDILELPDASGMVMELLDGCSLSTFYRVAGVPMALPRALRLFSALASALRHAHREGVVHRDLKPSNIYLHRIQDAVVPKVMDFGVAKLQSTSMGNRLTATGTVLGTPHYMAPEQFEDSSGVDARADIFSLGVMLYEATTGMLPFEGQSITSLMKEILTHAPKRPSELYPEYPVELEAILMRCLQKRREDRYRNAGELETALRQCGLKVGSEEIPPESVPLTNLENRGIEITTVGTVADGEVSFWDEETGISELGKGSIETVVLPGQERPPGVTWNGTQVSRTRPTEEAPHLTSATVPGYRIIRRVYESSETIVYRAVSLDDPLRKVVIKVINSEYPSPQQVARLKHEYAVIRDLEVRGIPRVVGLERYRNGLALILEDVGGETLRARLERGQLGIAEFLEKAIRLAEILSQLHGNNLIHKDINPKNIIVPKGGDDVQIIDFGLATQMASQHEEAGPTGGMEGTLLYMSPEQTGRMNRPVDYRTDFYSLGVTLYEMLCGRTPFTATDRAELVHCHLAVVPPLPRELNPDIPAALSDLVMKLLNKNAEDRYQSGRGLRADLAECLKRWRATGKIEPFELAEQDISDKFQIPQKLYGRDGEVSTLLATFDRVAQGYKEMMLVAGYAGVGKTSLVREIYKPVTRRRGYFITGKFDQYKRDIPYGALIEAFQGLVRELLSEGEEQLAAWRDKLLETLGPNGRLIIDVIPEVALIIGEQPPAPELPAAEALNRFNLLFHAFIGVFAQESHPLVLFLDDLQWADNASLNLLHVAMTGTEHQHLFLIGAYRDNEVDAAHPLRSTMEDITKAGTCINRIQLKPLALPHISQLVADTLNCTLQEAAALSELLEQKTGGNPYFMGEFLKSLYEQELISFATHAGQWEWDTARIQAEGITDNVVDLMAGKIRRMRPGSQQALKLAACIGNLFELQTLALVSGKSPSDVINSLQEAVSEGLVLLLGDAYKYLELDRDELAEGLLDAVLLQAVRYKFAHDKVQQAAYSLIPEEARQTIHRQIGLLVLHDTTPEKRQARVFDIVNQLNEGIDLAKTPEERRELAELNLLAARRANASAAYRSAYRYLQTGIQLLPEDAWKSTYELTLQFHQEAAETAYLCTDFEGMESHVQLVLDRAQSLEEKIPVYETRIQGYIAQARKVEAISTGLSVMRLLKVHVPDRPTMAHVVLALARTRLALAGKGVEELLDRPLMTNPRVLTAMRISTLLSSTAYVIYPNLFPVLVLKQVELSARYGNGPVSAFAYSLYGTILCGVLGDIPTGYRFGRMALKLQEKLEEREYAPRTIFTSSATSQHYMEPLREALAPLLDGYKRAMENGDLEFMATCAGVYNYHLFFSGRNLLDYRSEMTYYAEVLEQIKQEAYLRYLRLYLQFAINLLGDGERSWTLAGPVCDLEEYIAATEETSDGHGLANAYLLAGMLRLLGCDYKGALELFDKGRTYLFSNVAMVPHLVFHFYDGLACAAWHDEAPEEQRRALRRRVSYNLRKLRKWARHVPATYLHKWHLVKAEACRLAGRYPAAMEHYDQAIDLAQQHGFQQDQAMANEAAARFHLSRGKERIARTYMTDAYHHYHQWGAVIKERQLEKQYPELLATAIAATTSLRDTLSGASTYQSTTSSTTASGSDRLDVNAVLRASQVLSAEIHLDRLLQQVMAIVLENAGAQRGLLFLETDGKFYAEAEAIAGQDAAVVLQHQPVRERRDVAQSIINYVMRLREDVVLEDATNDSNFARDEYIIEHRPKSILCMPLRYQNRLGGILYLENNLMVGAFTPSRVQVLSLLATEVVIALDNARLYDDLQATNRTLEVRVQERTRDLQQANLELSRAHRKADELLRNVLPTRVAEELKEHGSARPERFEEVTVFFSDFVDFTTRAAALPPETLLEELNEMFTAFDGIVTGNGCERIKTVGDAYLFVCGMPDPDESHAEKVVHCALEIRDYLVRRNLDAAYPWQLRIGIHSGPVVGGVVGIQKYIYDVFGDTINTASRMESHSEPMRVNVSEVTWERVKDRFDGLPRPPVDVKGKGPMRMFFVEPHQGKKGP